MEEFLSKTGITIQIVNEVSILSGFMPFLAYRDMMRAEGPKHYPYILGMA